MLANCSIRCRLLWLCRIWFSNLQWHRNRWQFNDNDMLHKTGKWFDFNRSGLCLSPVHSKQIIFIRFFFLHQLNGIRLPPLYSVHIDEMNKTHNEEAEEEEELTMKNWENVLINNNWTSEWNRILSILTFAVFSEFRINSKRFFLDKSRRKFYLWQ